MKIKFKNLLGKMLRFIVVLLLLLAICIIIFGIFPNYKNIKILKSTFRQKQNLLEVQKNNLDVLEALQKKYLKAQEKFEQIQKALPSRENIPSLLVQMESLAVLNNMLFNSISFDTEKNEVVAEQGIDEQGFGFGGASYKTTTISIALQGSYKDFKKYLQSIENNLRLMDIKLLNISASPMRHPSFEGIEQSSFDNELLFNLKIHTYYRE